MQIVNLTPHPVVILRDDPEGEVVGFTGNPPAVKEGRFSVVATFHPEPQSARAVQRDEIVGALEIDGHSVPVVHATFGEPYMAAKGLDGVEVREQFPAPAEGVYLVVSVITAQAAKALGRPTDDLLITSDPVRDDKGKFIGVRKFALL